VGIFGIELNSHNFFANRQTDLSVRTLNNTNRGGNNMGKRLGIYIFDNAEVIDWAAPTGVFAVARRMDPELDTFLIADTLTPIVATAGLRVLPKYGLNDKPAMDAFLIPGGLGTRAEIHNRRLLDFVTALPSGTLLVSVCTGSWVYGVAGLLDGIRATNRKNGDPSETLIPIDRLAQLAPRCVIDRHRVVDSCQWSCNNVPKMVKQSVPPMKCNR